MVVRVLLAALLAGIAAGLIVGVIQHVRLTPYILHAETYELAHLHRGEGETPESVGTAGRQWFTLATTAVAGAGFASVLTGLSLLTGIAIDRRNGLFWGLAGFVAVSLAPAAGLPPELPGMATAHINARIGWWLFTIVATGVGLWTLTVRRELWAVLAALIVITLPHIVGAPQPPTHESAIPAGLYAAFVTNSLAINGLFWSLIGIFLGFTLEKFEKEIADD
jgi:cobalt transporter subunit CbtA